MTAIFCGPRVSELRGLPWRDVDLNSGVLHVRQRADELNKIGKPKSRAGYRTIQMPPIVINALREWKLACPKGALGLVFPNKLGNVESYTNIVQYGFGPIQIAAASPGCTMTAEQSPSMECTRGGTPAHRFRSSRAIIRNGFQTMMGHSTIQITFDVYGHLFKDEEADARAAESVQVRLLGS